MNKNPKCTMSDDDNAERVRRARLARHTKIGRVRRESNANHHSTDSSTEAEILPLSAYTWETEPVRPVIPTARPTIRQSTTPASSNMTHNQEEVNRQMATLQSAAKGNEKSELSKMLRNSDSSKLSKMPKSNIRSKLKPKHRLLNKQ